MPKGFTEEDKRELIATLKNTFDGKDIVEVVKHDFRGIDDETVMEIVENTSTWRDLKTELESLENQPKQPAKLSEAEMKKLRSDVREELDAKYAKKFETEREKLRKEFEKALEKDKAAFRKEFEGKQPKTQESTPEPAQPAPKAPEPQPAPQPAPAPAPKKSTTGVWTNPDGSTITVIGAIKNKFGEYIEIPDEDLEMLKKYGYVSEDVTQKFLAYSVDPKGNRVLGTYKEYVVNNLK